MELLTEQFRAAIDSQPVAIHSEILKDIVRRIIVKDTEIILEVWGG
jgi:hypothetical protein